MEVGESEADDRTSILQTIFDILASLQPIRRFLLLGKFSIIFVQQQHDDDAITFAFAQQNIRRW